MLACSMAACRAGAEGKGVPLCQHINQLAAQELGEPVKMVMPVPCLNVINGGVHAGKTTLHPVFFFFFFIVIICA